MACVLIDNLANPAIKTLKPFKPGKPIEELRRECTRKNIIKLASNENPLGPSKLAIEAIRRSLHDLKFYPDPNGVELKQTIANYLKVQSTQITLGNGSEDIMTLLAYTFVSKKNHIITSQHEFITYSLIANKVGAKPIAVSTKNWSYDLNSMLTAITEKTRLLFIANPKNPTGTRIDAIQLKKFLDAVPTTVLVILDEAYFEYVEAPDHLSGIDLLSFYPNLIITRTFSKIHGLASLRIGYSVSCKEIAELLNRVRMPFNVNRLGLVAATAAIQDNEHIRNSIQLNNEGKKQLQEAFNELSLHYLPSFGNFITIELDRPTQPIYEFLLTEGMIIRPLDTFGMPKHLRITVGLEHQNTRLIRLLKKTLSKPYKKF